MLIAEYGASALLPPIVLLAALLIDAIVGEFGPLFRVLPHPVAVIGGITGWLDRRLNRERRATATRAVRGALVVLVLAGALAALGWAAAKFSRTIPYGWGLELLLVVLLLAQRSLFDHVRAVAQALTRDGLAGGRAAVAQIVGRDPGQLDEHGVARAAVESLAESFADGVVAPAVWFALFGLAGLAAYKAVNTLDSMIGYRDARYADFGRAAARLDDAVNWLPARLAGLVFVAAAALLPGASAAGAWRALRRDAPRHRSPNAGWQEAALAGALGFALAGPRRYGGRTVDDHWMGDGRSDLTAADLRRALALYRVAGLLLGLGVLVLAAALSRQVT